MVDFAKSPSILPEPGRPKVENRFRNGFPLALPKPKLLEENALVPIPKDDSFEGISDFKYLGLNM